MPNKPLDLEFIASGKGPFEDDMCVFMRERRSAIDCLRPDIFPIFLRLRAAVEFC